MAQTQRDVTPKKKKKKKKKKHATTNTHTERKKHRFVATSVAAHLEGIVRIDAVAIKTVLGAICTLLRVRQREHGGGRSQQQHYSFSIN
jgi:hypothetical protein